LQKIRKEISELNFCHKLLKNALIKTINRRKIVSDNKKKKKKKKLKN
jgi:hypothetical protein